MTKRVTAVITAIVMTLCVLLGGCKGRMSKEEYLATVHDDLLTYTTASKGYLTMMKNTMSSSSAQSGLKQYSSKITPYFDTLDKIYSELKSINPPKEYDDLHSKLKKSIELEEEMLELLRELFNTESVEDMAAAVEKYSLLAARMDEADKKGESFAQIALQLAKEYKNTMA